MASAWRQNGISALNIENNSVSIGISENMRRIIKNQIMYI